MKEKEKERENWKGKEKILKPFWHFVQVKE